MNCFLYAKLIRDLIMCGVGGFVAYLIVRFRWWILFGVVTAVMFTIGWLFGSPKIVRDDDTDCGVPYSIDMRRYSWQGHDEVPNIIKYPVLGLGATTLLAFVGWGTWALGVAIYHRYWVC